MTLFYINSFNDMNTFPIGKRTVSVNSIDDAELASMKLHSNPRLCQVDERRHRSTI